MEYIKKLNNPKLVEGLLKEISYNKRPIKIMEVCGTHTMSIWKNGIKELLPSNIELISGPGCPVCVTPKSYIDKAIELSKKDNIIITTFGDMIKVPGSNSSLKREKAFGRDIRIVLSPLDSIKIAKKNPKKEVVFLGIGFETTAPIIALSIDIADKENIKNYSILQGLKTMPNAIKTIIIDPEINIDGFIYPGHVSTIIGVKPFYDLSKEIKIPGVVAGFQYMDIIVAIYFLVKMINKKEGKVKNIYNRVVKYEGNKRALSMIDKIFTPSSSIWRGLGNIENTGLILKKKYNSYNIESKLDIKEMKSKVNKDCLCGEILKGKRKPIECELFVKICNPSNPIGPCMISREGSCGAYYTYGKI